ncbi:MAG TPA: hypothetical protein VL523_13250 [Terriglobia bacterium]|nr:hypothetical protein [Terriglobia bacterium]
MRFRGPTFGGAPTIGVLAGLAALMWVGGAVPAALHLNAPEPGAAQVAQRPRPPAPPEPMSVEPQPDTSSAPTTPKQQRAILKARFEKMKDQADQLAQLAQALQADLHKSNENVLSLGVVEKADKIEKLAKQIKSAAVE